MYTQVEGALCQQAATVQMQAEQESQQLCVEIEPMMCEQVVAVKKEINAEIGRQCIGVDTTVRGEISRV